MPHLPGTSQAARLQHHRNAFGFLRLVLAAMVIFSHTPIMLDGNVSREPFAILIHGVQAGQLAVSGFFIISGYLITGSYLSTPSPARYILKRLARIYPAYILCCALCLLVVAPLGGASWPGSGVKAWASAVAKVGLLQGVDSPGVFRGTHFAVLNGALWTIFYEFRCYLLVLVIGALGLFRRPPAIILLTLAVYIGTAFLPGAAVHSMEHFHGKALWGGNIGNVMWLVPLFLSGSCFYLYRDRITYSWRLIAVASAGLIACLPFAAAQTPGLAIFGPVVVLGIATLGTGPLLSGVNNKNDISYGTYLYGWPVGKLVLWYFPNASLMVADIAILVLALGCGAVSWYLVEQPVLRYLQPASRRKAVPAFAQPERITG